jgi:hypothetical protein
LAILGFLKFSSLDQSGMGVEMEGGKPGWNDAMNGLPGEIERERERGIEYILVTCML